MTADGKRTEERPAESGMGAKGKSLRPRRTYASLVSASEAHLVARGGAIVFQRLEKVFPTIGKLLAAVMLVAGAFHAHAQEAEETLPRVVLGEADLADRAEIARNLYRRITPGDGPLIQDTGTWPAAWEEFGEGWIGAVAEREFGTWSVPISLMQESGTTVVRDAAGRELWRGTTDFARPESAGVALTGALVGEDEWDVHEAIKGAVTVLETGESVTPDVRQDSIPRRGGAITNGLRFTSVEVETNGMVQLSLAWEEDGEVDVFAYGALHEAVTNVSAWTNDENMVVTSTNVAWHSVEPGLAGFENAWEWVGTSTASNGVAAFADANFPVDRGIVRFYAAASAADADGDGLNDGFEVFVSHTDSGSADTDGDGVPDGSDPYPAAANVFWTVTTTNEFRLQHGLGTCPSNAPARKIATVPVAGDVPTADSVVWNVAVSGFVDDNIKVDESDVDWRRDIHEFDNRDITDAIADLQSGQFGLELWDYPRADYAGPNEVRLGDTNGNPFLVEWTWKVPVAVTGPDLVCPGETAQMGVSWADGGPYSWSVSGSAASIGADGILTALTTGVATVTASNAAGWTVGKDVMVVEIGGIAVDPADSKSFLLGSIGATGTVATVKGSGQVSLLAAIDPDTPETRAWISWQGADVDPGNPLKATLNRGTAGKREVRILAGGESKCQVDVWVVWCEFTEFNNTGPTPADCGVFPPAYGATTGLKNGMVLQCTISPQGFWNVPGVQYDIKRTKERATWALMPSGWRQMSHVGPGADDDGYNGDEDLTPSAEGHIYSMDSPGFPLQTTSVEEAVYKASFVEFAAVKLGASDWLVCSDDYAWHSITWAENDGNGNLLRKVGAPNEIAPGPIFVGTAQSPQAGNGGTGGEI